MKRFLIASIFIIFVFLLACKQEKEIYSGYIYFNKKPVKRAKIADDYKAEYQTFTDNEGYFILKKPDNYYIHKIIITQQNKEVDTIDLMRKAGADAMPDYIFLRAEVVDTLHLDRERIFKKQFNGN